ncbi:MAG TPA: DUF2380 domain-containing protein [Myxococcota bacterium]|jgi:TolB-like protein
MIMIAAPLLALACTAPAGHATLLVLEFKSSADESALAHALTQESAAALSDRGFAVVSSSDLKNAVDLHGEKQLAGCDDSGCAAELAGALGADLVLFGDVTHAGDLLVVSVQLYDAKRASTVNRAVVRGTSVSDVVSQARSAVRGLVPDGGGPSAIVVAGAVGAGVGAVALAVGAVGVLWANGVLDDATSLRADKDSASAAQPIAGAAIVAGAVVLAGSAVTALVGVVAD